jgi:glycosyltransferase involved in cell wall biosynthesis
LVTALRSRDVPLYSSRSRNRDYLAEISAIRRVQRETGAEVMHFHAYRADILGVPAAVGLHTATVATAHGITGGGLKNRFYEWLELRALRQFDAVIAVSSPLEELLRQSGVSQERLCLVQNAVLPLPLLDRSTARSRLGLPASQRAVGWIGRLSWEKGPDIFIEALARMQRPSVRAVMVGDGAERESLEATASRLGVADRIRFVGSIPDAGELLAAFDLVVLSSRTEGLPISLLEAMSAGVPLVASRVGDVPAATAHGRFAELVPAADPAALAEAMNRTLAAGPTASDRARSAREWVELHFGVEPWLDKIAAAYQQAMQRREGH